MKTTSMSCLAALLLGTQAAQGGIDPTPFQESPLIGASLGQTLRITIAGAGDVCEATLGFRNQKGESIPAGARARTVLLKRGETAFHDLNFNAFVTKLGQRFEVRAAVVVTFPPDPIVPPCRWSAEIFDQFSKRTTLIYAYPPDPVAPLSGETPLPPLGGAFGQTVRLGVVADSEPPPTGGLPAPCQVEAHIHSAAGAIVAAKVFKLAPGEADYLDLNMNGLVRFAERGIINPCFMPVAPGSAAGCKVSVQVFDQLTGWTQGFMAPAF